MPLTCSKANQTAVVAPTHATEMVRAIERKLSEHCFMKVPIGGALAGLLDAELWGGAGDWSARGRFRNRVGFYYHYLKGLVPRRREKIEPGSCRGQVLATWSGSSFRLRDLVFPVAREIGYDRCMLLSPRAGMNSYLPSGARGLDLGCLTGYQDGSLWRCEFARFWKMFRPTLKEITREYKLPAGVYHRLADATMVCTQQIASYQTFLRRSQVAGILADHDRARLWAPLVLSANALGLPTFTLVHGMFGDKGAAFYPVLARKIYCWGEIQGNILLAEGADATRIVIGGCPRLTRETKLSPAEARVKMGLDPVQPVVILATEGYQSPAWGLKLAEAFCRATEGTTAFTGVIRLHPNEKLERYAPLAVQFPGIHFMTNETVTLDEALAAADIVVVHSTGFGSDALVKGRLTVVLDAITHPLGYGQELIDAAGCPRATSVDSLREILLRLLGDPEERDRRREAAENYVRKFCLYYGEDSARRIAAHVRCAIQADGTGVPPSNSGKAKPGC